MLAIAVGGILIKWQNLTKKTKVYFYDLSDCIYQKYMQDFHNTSKSILSYHHYVKVINIKILT